jgi:hypothetical protein
MADKSYIISYPISAGKDFNMVLSHHTSRLVEDVEEVDINEFRDTYRDYDPRTKKIVDMVPLVKRWPLLVTGPLDTWSLPGTWYSWGKAAHRDKWCSTDSVWQRCGAFDGQPHGARRSHIDGGRRIPRPYDTRCGAGQNQ